MRQRVTRRALLKWGLAGTGAVVLAACAPKAPTAAPTKPAAAKATDTPKPAPKEAVEIEVWVQEAFGKECWENVDKAYHAAQDEVKVKRFIFPHGDMEAKVLTALAGGETIDVVYVHPMLNNTYAIKGAIIPLDDYMPDLGIPEDDWYPVINYHRWRGKTWALPYQDNPWAMAYNPDLVEEAGLESPRDLWKKGEWTYDTFVEYAAKLTKGTGADK